MCTVVLLHRPGHGWPLLLAANRDERLDRPWDPPARHWPDRPEVVAGRDRLAGGSWMGLNDAGLVAVVLNGRHELGPATDKRSRGELVLDALDHADAADAAEALAALDPAAYRPFHLVVADDRDAFCLSHADPDGVAPIESVRVPTGRTVLVTAYGLDRADSPRTSRFGHRFAGAAVPDPDRGDWSAWKTLLADGDGGGDPDAAMEVRTDWGYGTGSSSLLALPSVERVGVPPVWIFAPGPPSETSFEPVDQGARPP